jgi:hypothetical protein
MIKLTVFLLGFTLSNSVFAQSSLTDTLASYFNEVKIATQKHKSLWGINIYGPIILVNPTTRQAYSNYPDSLGTLNPAGKIYSGILPNDIVLGNATTFWHGTHWAMVMMPFLSKTNKADRINLLSHELFHRSQEKLKFKLTEPTNNHLDQKEGRVLLRLELEELKKASQVKENSDVKQHLANALSIRKYRYKIFPGADTSENWAELNEGIAEYSGVMMSGRSNKEIEIRFQQKIDELMSFGTFVRTFAYRTTPVYGYCLKKSNKNWNKEINITTNLTAFFIKQLGLSIPTDLSEFMETYTKQDFAKSIIADETEREEKTKKQIALYKDRFIVQSHFEILFEKKSISFDSRNLMPLENYGIVYPTLTASDNWGILKVEAVGGLLSPARDKIIISAPTNITEKEINGIGWSLQLNNGYTVLKDEKSGNYKLIKN